LQQEFSPLHNTAGFWSAFWPVGYAERSVVAAMGLEKSITRVLHEKKIYHDLFNCKIYFYIIFVVCSKTYRFGFLQLLLSILIAARLRVENKRKKNQTFDRSRAMRNINRIIFEPILRQRRILMDWKMENGVFFFCTVRRRPENSHKEALIIIVKGEMGAKIPKKGVPRDFKERTFDTIHQT
jgi:hypothetical protein